MTGNRSRCRFDRGFGATKILEFAFRVSNHEKPYAKRVIRMGLGEFMDSCLIGYDPSLYSRWKEGSLAKEWLQRYPDVISEKYYNDRIKSQARLGNHFAESLMAIRYRELGWKVLVEKYMWPKYNERHIVQRFVGAQKIGLIQQPGGGKKEAPDLFVYKERGPFFFVEVKKDNETMKPEQKQRFERIAKEVPCKVIEARLHPEKILSA